MTRVDWIILLIFTLFMLFQSLPFSEAILYQAFMFLLQTTIIELFAHDLEKDLLFPRIIPFLKVFSHLLCNHLIQHDLLLWILISNELQPLDYSPFSLSWQRFLQLEWLLKKELPWFAYSWTSTWVGIKCKN